MNHWYSLHSQFVVYAIEANTSHALTLPVVMVVVHTLLLQANRDLEQSLAFAVIVMTSFRRQFVVYAIAASTSHALTLPVVMVVVHALDTVCKQIATSSKRGESICFEPSARCQGVAGEMLGTPSHCFPTSRCFPIPYCPVQQSIQLVKWYGWV